MVLSVSPSSIYSLPPWRDLDEPLEFVTLLIQHILQSVVTGSVRFLGEHAVLMIVCETEKRKKQNILMQHNH